MAMLLITHDLGVVAGRADRVMVMYAGRIVEHGDDADVFDRMRHPYTQALLESIPASRPTAPRSCTASRVRRLTSPTRRPAAASPPRCRSAQDRCRTEDPSLGGSDPAHTFACFYPVAGHVGAGWVARRHCVAPAQGTSQLQAEATEPGPPLLVLEDVVKEFPITKGILQRKVASVKAVSGVSLEIQRGETFGLVGESGCGKTTLGRLIAGIEKLDSGTITFDGAGCRTSAARRCGRRRERCSSCSRIRMPRSTPGCGSNRRCVSRWYAQRTGSPAEQEARILQLLEDVGLAPRALDLYPHEFSGGQRQRIGFARALTVEPRLIIADEPVSALDVSIRSQILNLMKRLQRERDLTYVSSRTTCRWSATSPIASA